MYDQAELDAQYDNFRAIPDAASYPARWRAQSEETRRRHVVARDVTYGPAPRQTLDIYLPRVSDAPVHVFFHGGFWRSQDKATFAFIAGPLIEAGAAVVIPNYDLCPSVTIDDIVHESRAAIAWVHQHAAVFAGDPEMITVSGHSAGGHLLARALEADWSRYDAPADVVKGGVSISGLFDLEPVRRSYHNDDLRLTDEQVRRNSPLLHTPERRVPLMLGVGADETDEFVRQTRDYAATLRAQDFEVETSELAGMNHFNILDAAFSTDDALGILAMMAR